MGSLGTDVAQFPLDDVDAAVSARPTRLAVAGGDGSLAPVARRASRAGLELAVIPTGTANDFARAMGIPLDTEAACELAVRGRSVRRVDLGLMDDRPFLNVASLGLPPAAARRASGLKGALGPLAYAAGALAAGLQAQPVECRVCGDGAELFAGAAWQVTVAGSGAFGAGSSVEADPADGKLDLVVIEAGSRARLAGHAYALRTGGLAEQDGVRKARCANATIELGGDEPFNVDGEIVRSGSCDFAVERDGVAVVVG
jgi:diacylglycerol kinase family enzyme